MKIILIFISIIAVLCSGCRPLVKENPESAAKFNSPAAIDYNKDHYPVTIENINYRTEREVFTYKKPPERVVAVWQNSIETLLALGVGDRIIAAMGVPDKKYFRSEYQKQYEKIPYTSFELLSIEEVLMLQPDLIVGWHSTFGDKVLRGTDFWRSRNVNTYMTPSSVPGKKEKLLEDEYQDILNMGKIFDKNEKAQQIVSQMRNEIQFVQNNTHNLKERPKGIIIEFLGKDITVYNEKTLAGNIFKSLNGELLAPKENKIGIEQLVDLNPDAIFVVIIESEYGREQDFLNHIYENTALSHLKCVREKRVYPLPLYAIYSSGVRTYDGIQIMAHGLYPELYKE